MKITALERKIIAAIKSGGVIIPGAYPCIAFYDGRPEIYFSFAKFCDMQYKGILVDNRRDIVLAETFR